jgi:hypothetical protein
MNIFQEIVESRMIRQVSQLDGLTVQQLGEKLLEHLLGLEILAIKAPARAALYAGQIVSAINFAGFRQTQPDLYNLIVFLLKSSQFDQYVDYDQTVIIPEFQLKRNLRNVADGNIDLDDFNQLMLILQRRLPSINSQLMNLRREISDYPDLDSGDQQQILYRLMMQMRERQVNSDLYQELDKLYRKHQS